MRELWFLGPRHVEVRQATSMPGALRGIASLVSQGTELLLYKGEAPIPFDPSLGVTSYPCRYGYAWVGEDAAGDRFFALAPHADEQFVPARALRRLPRDVPPGRATLAANMEAAVTCVWDAEPALGDRAVVLGGGVVGILTAWLLERAGLHVTLVEPQAARRAAARALCTHLADRAVDASADLVVEATGNPQALDAAIACARDEARIVVASFYGTRRAPLDLGDAFHRRRLELRASQVSRIPPRLSARWSYERRFALVTDLLHDPVLDSLFAPPVPFERAPELYASLADESDVPPAHVFVYR